jgi:SpoVK/Ycf46/Vps4 family AAA+-type ATPase
MRNTVNQLLIELDGIDADNDGLFMLAATNQPWDVDPALRRPGRFDRTVLVLPPDAGARLAIVGAELRNRPVVEGLDLNWLVAATDGYSGADLVHVVDTAGELALAASVRQAAIVPIGRPFLESALGQVRPSVGAWFETARNVTRFANDDGQYDELAAYFERRRRR